MSRRFFSETNIDSLLEARSQSIDEIARVNYRTINHAYKSDRGKEHGHHGFSRRLRTISRAIERIFEFVPPGIDRLPDREERIDAEAFLQALIVAAYGAADNLAAMWVYETGLLKPDGRPLPETWIGLRPNNTAVRASLPEETQKKIRTFDEWFLHIEDYRHALAHRIPFYIPPYNVSDDDAAEYNILEQQKFELIKSGKFDTLDEIEARQKSMEFFQPLIVHSWGERSTPVVFHPMAIVAARTVCEMGSMILDALDRRYQSASATSASGS